MLLPVGRLDVNNLRFEAVLNATSALLGFVVNELPVASPKIRLNDRRLIEKYSNQ